MALSAVVVGSGLCEGGRGQVRAGHRLSARYLLLFDKSAESKP